METSKAKLLSNTKAEIQDDLKYWQKKLDHYKKTGNKNGIRVVKLLLDKYLDAYNNAIL